MRLPFQGKISSGQYIQSARTFDRPEPADIDAQIRIMKQCLSVFSWRCNDILPESIRAVPIIMVKP